MSSFPKGSLWRIQSFVPLCVSVQNEGPGRKRTFYCNPQTTRPPPAWTPFTTAFDSSEIEKKKSYVLNRLVCVSSRLKPHVWAINSCDHLKKILKQLEQMLIFDESLNHHGHEQKLHFIGTYKEVNCFKHWDAKQQDLEGTSHKHEHCVGCEGCVGFSS